MEMTNTKNMSLSNPMRTNPPSGRSQVNVQTPERIASALGGGALTIFGATKGGLSGLGLMLLGGGLLWRGVSGHCGVYEMLGINSAQHPSRNAAVRHNQGIKIEKSVTIEKSPAELFQYWRQLENLPRFMSHLETVEVLDDRRSRWVAKAPLGTSVEWEAEIINEKANELIAWRTVPGAALPNAGSVRFEPKPGGETIVRVTMNYEPPGGTLGATLAKLFGTAPEQQIEADLLRFKQIMETGETASTTGQATGKGAGGKSI